MMGIGTRVRILKNVYDRQRDSSSVMYKGKIGVIVGDSKNDYGDVVFDVLLLGTKRRFNVYELWEV